VLLFQGVGGGQGVYIIYLGKVFFFEENFHLCTAYGKLLQSRNGEPNRSVLGRKDERKGGDGSTGKFLSIALPRRKDFSSNDKEVGGQDRGACWDEKEA